MAGTDAEGAILGGVNDGVGLDVLDGAPAEKHGLEFVLAWVTLGDDFEIGGGGLPEVALLHEERLSADGADVPRHDVGRVEQQPDQTQVFLLLQQLECVGGEVGGDDDLGENLADRPGGGQVEHGVAGNDAAERRLPIGRVGLGPRVGEGVGLADAAGVSVLEDGERGWVDVELDDQPGGGGEVENVVVRKRLAVELLIKLTEAAVKGGALVGVLAVAQNLSLVSADDELVRQAVAWLLLLVNIGQVQGDRAVVGGGAGVHLHSQLAAEFECGFAVLGDLIGDAAVVGGVDNDGDALVVFGRAAKHRRAADVDVLDGVLEGDIRLGDGLLERVEVHDDEIDRPDAVLGGGGGVFLIFAHEKQATVNLGMQRLDAAVEHLGETGIVAEFLRLDAGFAQCPGGAAGGDDLDAGTGEYLGEGNQVGLVGNGNERALNLGHDGVAWVTIVGPVSGLAMFPVCAEKIKPLGAWPSSIASTLGRLGRGRGGRHWESRWPWVG